MSPELEEYSSKYTISKHADARDKSNFKHESVVNGLSRKNGPCKASSKRYIDTSSVKKNLSKLSKAVNI